MGEITSFVNARDLRFGCARVLYEGLLGAALMNGTEKIMNAQLNWVNKKVGEIIDGSSEGVLDRVNECRTVGLLKGVI